MKRLTERHAREARQMKVREVILRVQSRELTWIQAAEICGYTPRHMRRIRKKVEEHGFESLEWDGRRGRPRVKRVAANVVKKILTLRREKYRGFHVQHFYEKLSEEKVAAPSYTYVKNLLQDAGLAERAAARGKYRRLRPRRTMRGMMVHQDGSTHDWLSNGSALDLVITLDDADGKILHGLFWREEGTESSLYGIRAVVKEHGLFREFYTDRGSHYAYTRKAGDPPDRSVEPQVAQVLRALHVKHILARSPEARGRSERMFRTLQGRLPQELKLRGIRTIETANAYLEKEFLPAFNRLFTVEPTESGSAFVPYVGDIDDVVCERYDRTVGKDHAVMFERQAYVLPKPQGRASYAGCAVEVLKHLDGRISIAYGTEIVARFDNQGCFVGRKARRTAA